MNQSLKGLIVKDRHIIRFVNADARAKAFEILGEEYIRKYTMWKGPGIWK